jgi:hypothetical protein
VAARSLPGIVAWHPRELQAARASASEGAGESEWAYGWRQLSARDSA